LAVLGSLGYRTSGNPEENFKKIVKENDPLATLALRNAIVTVVPEVVEYLLAKNTIWNYRLELFDAEECPCINCSGRNLTCKEIALRLSLDSWYIRTDIYDLSSKITRIQTLFLTLGDQLKDYEIVLFLIRNPKEAYEILLRNGYSKERIVEALTNEKYNWIMSFIEDERMIITSTVHSEPAKADDIRRFISDVADGDYRENFEFLHDFVKNNPAYSKLLFTQAISARSFIAVKNMIRLGIFGYEIGNPFEFLTGPSQFKETKDGDVFDILANYGFKVNWKAVSLLLSVQDLDTVTMLLDYLDESVTLDALDEFKDFLFDNTENAGILVYYLVNREQEQLRIGEMQIDDSKLGLRNMDTSK